MGEFDCPHKKKTTCDACLQNVVEQLKRQAEVEIAALKADLRAVVEAAQNCRSHRDTIYATYYAEQLDLQLARPGVKAVMEASDDNTQP